MVNEHTPFLGPLAALVGTWEGDQGIDVAFSHEVGEVLETPFRERASFSSFGPVDNGRQHLYGLDYRTAAWKEGQEDPFHTEVGYWLWDGDAGHVMKGFLVPRGVTVLAGGEAGPDDKVFEMVADHGAVPWGISSNPYLVGAANSVHYEVTVTVGDDGSFSYDEDTVLEMNVLPDPLHHTDRNTLHRVD